MPENPLRNTAETSTSSFTVIGFWPDTDQRFCDTFHAPTAAVAEDQCLQAHPGIAVCGVIAGRHACVDVSPYLKRD